MKLLRLFLFCLGGIGLISQNVGAVENKLTQEWKDLFNRKQINLIEYSMDGINENQLDKILFEIDPEKNNKEKLLANIYFISPVMEIKKEKNK